MGIKFIDEVLKELENECEVHDLKNESCGGYPVGRFGGDCISLYECKKCNRVFYKSEEYNEMIKKYDERGMLKEK